MVVADITAALALATGTTARVIAARRLRAVGAIAEETTATREEMEAEIGVVMAAREQAGLKVVPKVVPKAAGRRSHRRAILAVRRQRRRRSSHGDLCRMLANLSGVRNRRSNPSTTTRVSPHLACMQNRPNAFQRFGRFLLSAENLAR